MTILNSSAESAEASAAEPVDALSQILDCPTADKSQGCLNQSIRSRKCKVAAALPFATFLISGDWIARDSKGTDKISLLFLGPNNKGNARKLSSKDCLSVRFQQLFRSALSQGSIDSLVSCNFSEENDFFSFNMRLNTRDRTF